MILSNRVALNGRQLDELDSRIVISGIDEAAGKDTISAVSSAAGNGQRITQMRRDTLDVTVKFRLMIRKTDMIARSALLEVVNAWAAQGGELHLGRRPDRRLLVVLAQAPGAGDLWQWTNEFTLTFRAYPVPFWEDDAETKVKGAVAASGSLAIKVPGTTKTDMCILAENKSGATIDRLVLTVAAQTMQFNGMNLGGTQFLRLNYLQTIDTYVFQAKINNWLSVLSLRNPDSVDDFVVNPGNVKVTWSASRAVQITAYCRGRYL